MAARDSDDPEARALFRHFFGERLPRDHPPLPSADDPAPQRVRRGVGSGFIVSRDGDVLTNAHVVDTDKRTDVAVLKIAATGLPTLATGESGQTKAGEWVIAIGSPFDLDNTVTAGIVSARARETGDFLPPIQTDVPVNPGNSGGPLINLRGQVVGIDSQIYSRSGGFMGVSFAIPIEDALRVAGQLQGSGYVTRGRLGVVLADVDRDVADALGLADTRGGFVGRIERGGPAERAGLRPGDIILALDNADVASACRQGVRNARAARGYVAVDDAAALMFRVVPAHAGIHAERPWSARHGFPLSRERRFF